MDVSPPLPEEMQDIALGSSGLRAWQITTPHCRALISRQGGQLLEFQATGKRPLLWLSPQAHFQPGKAIRGGIPLCFPWFGPHPQASGKPAHGFARLRDWQLLRAHKTGCALQLDFQLQADAATRALWPHDFRAMLGMTLGRNLALQLHMENTGTTDFRFGFAFHSYFPVSDIRQVRVEGLDASHFIDQLQPGRPRRQQLGPVTFGAETDRIYLHTPSQYSLVDEPVGQAIRISAADCRSVVVWNPWQEKTARLADMAADAWQSMVCVESGNVEDDQVTLPAGATKAFAILIEGEA